MAMPAGEVAPVPYTAICERVGDWWEITVPELESGRVTQARSLEDVPATVADLVSVMTGADPANIEVHIQAGAEGGYPDDSQVRESVPYRVGFATASAVGLVAALIRRILHGQSVR